MIFAQTSFSQNPQTPISEFIILPTESKFLLPENIDRKPATLPKYIIKRGTSNL